MSPPPSADKPPSTAAPNPTPWRYTWEAQSHAPTLRLLLFNPKTKPSVHCRDIKLKLFPEQSVLAVAFIEIGENPSETSVLVPVPRVLIDSESPIHFRAFDDHIEVKHVLLLPVDHALVSGFDAILNSEENEDEFRPISLDSDVDKLSSMEEVNFYCRSCSAKLTTGLRCFREMPSVNWRDVADNWFGNCCCSFGGISEKLVAEYVKSYACEQGVCLLSTTSVLVCKTDILGREFPDVKAKLKFELHHSSRSDCCSAGVSPDEICKTLEPSCCGNQKEVVSEKVANFCHTEHDIEGNMECETSNHVASDHNLSCPVLQTEENEELMNGVGNLRECDNGCCSPNALGTSLTDATAQLVENQKVFQDGFLGSGFMIRSSGLSKDVQWDELLCPQCSCLIGAYPCFQDDVPLDGGVRLFKCHISASPSTSSYDAFRKYTLERMFTNQLLESAEDELSFRTVVRDIKSKSPILQIVLLNPNSWCCTGYSTEPAAKLVMYPTVKVLYSVCGRDMEVDRSMADRVRQNEADEVYMFSSQIVELVRALDANNSLTPPSSRSLQGLLLSSTRR